MRRRTDDAQDAQRKSDVDNTERRRTLPAPRSSSRNRMIIALELSDGETLVGEVLPCAKEEFRRVATSFFIEHSTHSTRSTRSTHSTVSHHLQHPLHLLHLFHLFQLARWRFQEAQVLRYSKTRDTSYNHNVCLCVCVSPDFEGSSAISQCYFGSERS